MVMAISRPRTERSSAGDMAVRVAALEGHAAGGDVARAPHQPHDAGEGDALAGAGFADDAQALAGAHVSETPSTAVTETVRVGKHGPQVADRQQASRGGLNH